MSRRSLRPRKSQPTYSQPAIDELEDDRMSEPPIAALDDDASSGSDFAPEPEPAGGGPALDEDDEDEDMGAVSDEPHDADDMDVDKAVKKPTVSKIVRKPAKKPVRKTTIAGGSGHKNYSLPAPSVHHRHRAVPLHAPQSLVERLDERPELFAPVKTALTNAYTSDLKTSERLSKAWSYNVGLGPPWELVEDRAWYKEAKPGAQLEQDRRPLVYSDLTDAAEYTILSPEDAASYLPTKESDDADRDEDMEEDTERGETSKEDFPAPPPVVCELGPYGSQKTVEFSMLQARALCEFLPENKGHIFHPGAPVWGLDWCPIHPSFRAEVEYAQYLAVAPLPSHNYSPEVGIRVRRDACIQIWKLNQKGMQCEMVLCIDLGPALVLHWCPLPSHSKDANRLGLLSGTFQDGSFAIFAVPNLVRNESGPVHVHLEPILRIELVDTSCWSFEWANSEIVAIGTTNGILAIFDVGAGLRGKVSTKDIVPLHYISVHQSAIRALTWIRVPSANAAGEPQIHENPTVVASGGYDGMECMTDIREGRGSVINRTRDVINTMVFSPYAGGPITLDHENVVKAYSASPSMLGRGHTLFEPGGPVWNIATSELHAHIGIACSDGALTTTNVLRSTRRGGVPFWTYTVYQLDYNRNDNKYRFLERFMPTEMPPQHKTISWPREVGVNIALWNSCNGLGSAGLLASSTGSGLCRVDILEGRWMNEKFPYGDIRRARGETAGADDLSD